MHQDERMLAGGTIVCGRCGSSTLTKVQRTPGNDKASIAITSARQSLSSAQCASYTETLAHFTYFTLLCKSRTRAIRCCTESQLTRNLKRDSGRDVLETGIVTGVGGGDRDSQCCYAGSFSFHSIGRWHCDSCLALTSGRIS